MLTALLGVKELTNRFHVTVNLLNRLKITDDVKFG